MKKFRLVEFPNIKKWGAQYLDGDQWMCFGGPQDTLEEAESSYQYVTRDYTVPIKIIKEEEF